MARRKIVALALATGSVVGTVFVRRRQSRSRTRVDLYFDDGSMLSLPEDSEHVQELLPSARSILAGA
jgi:hypothetical protein